MVVGGLAIALTLAACGSSTSSESTPAAASEAPAASAPAAAPEAPAASSAPAAATGIDVGTGLITPINTTDIAYFIQAGETFSYSLAQEKGALDAGKDLGVNVDTVYMNLDPAQELAGFQSALTNGKYGGIIIQPLTAALCKQMAEEAVKYQVLIEVVGNVACGQSSEVGEALWSPGTMNYMGGTNGVDGILGLLDSAYELSPGPQKVMLALGIDGHGSTVAWQDAWKQWQPQHPDWELASEVFTDFTTPGSFSTVQNALQGNPEVTTIFALYVDVTAGVAKAIEAQGLQDQIDLYDNGGGSKVSVDLVKSGKQKGTLPTYPYSLGYQGVKVMVDAFNGIQPEKFIPGDGNPDASLRALTKDDMGAFVPQW